MDSGQHHAGMTNQVRFCNLRGEQLPLDFFDLQMKYNRPLPGAEILFLLQAGS